MSEEMAENLNHGETELHRVDSVRVFARMDDLGRPTMIDTIDEDERTVRAIADHLQRRGFGVMRKKKPRAGRTYHTLRAIWAGDGDPPEDPFLDEPGPLDIDDGGRR